jgi:hypothetical protein
MGFFGRLLGIEDESDRARQRGAAGPVEGAPVGGAPVGAPNSDAQAIERYRYMLKTAPPETVEQAHAEAFSKLTPEQRRTVLAQLTDAAPAAERAGIAATSPDDPQALARVATRAEVRQPGMMERTLGGGMGMGIGASLLSSFAMGFVGSMVAQSFMSAIGGFGGEDAAAGAEGEADGDQLADNDATETSAEEGYADDGMADGDFGGDFDV